MEGSAERKQNSYVRSRLTWARVMLLAGLVAVVLFTPIDWRGCGYFRRGAMEFLHFVYVFAWLVIFFASRMRWRFLLVLVTVPLILYVPGIPEESSGPEAAAVGALRQFRSSLDAYHIEHRQQGYPESLPSMTLSRHAQKFYKFEYVPARDANGKTIGYLVRATPRR